MSRRRLMGPPTIILPTAVGKPLGQQMRDLMPNTSAEGQAALLTAVAWGIFSEHDQSKARKQQFINMVAFYLEQSL